MYVIDYIISDSTVYDYVIINILIYIYILSENQRRQWGGESIFQSPTLCPPPLYTHPNPFRPKARRRGNGKLFGGPFGRL